MGGPESFAHHPIEHAHTPTQWGHTAYTRIEKNNYTPHWAQFATTPAPRTDAYVAFLLSLLPFREYTCIDTRIRHHFLLSLGHPLGCTMSHDFFYLPLQIRSSILIWCQFRYRPHAASSLEFIALHPTHHPITDRWMAFTEWPTKMSSLTLWPALPLNFWRQSLMCALCPPPTHSFHSLTSLANK